jgi:hypothetical protein
MKPNGPKPKGNPQIIDEHKSLIAYHISNFGLMGIKTRKPERWLHGYSKCIEKQNRADLVNGLVMHIYCSCRRALEIKLKLIPLVPHVLSRSHAVALDRERSSYHSYATGNCAASNIQSYRKVTGIRAIAAGSSIQDPKLLKWRREALPDMLNSSLECPTPTLRHRILQHTEWVNPSARHHKVIWKNVCKQCA